MVTGAAMTVEGLGKRYRVGGRPAAGAFALGRKDASQQSRARKEAGTDVEHASQQSRARKEAGTDVEHAPQQSRARKEAVTDVEHAPQQSRSRKEAGTDPEYAPQQSRARKEAGTAADRLAIAGESGRGRPGYRSSDDFWALRDASFEVQRGEVVGVIGRNGAGKSTLLKLLSRITEPTEGRARIRGRVRSLLEVGTGFHPELTGRDNVYLNGALLGMRRGEIRRKFDEIVAFAEVERFIDTPVKRYSSGMAVRLGFAVAAHLEPEILLVDEVLAVGDLGFQRKCLGKMRDVAGDGRTVLFVSHSMPAVQQLCPRAILIDGGRIAGDGPSAEIIHAYRRLFRETRDVPLVERTDREGTGRLRIVEASVRDAETRHVGVVAAGHTAEFRFRVVPQGATAPSPPQPPLPPALVLRMSLFDAQSNCLAHCSNSISGDRLPAAPQAEIALSCIVPRLPLNRGSYTLSASVGSTHEIYDYLQEIAAFDVTPGPFYSTGRLPEADHSSLLLDYHWTVEDSP